MRFLGIGRYNDLAAMYHGLARRGHEVRVAVEDPACRDVFAGMLDFTADWQRELGWLREAGQEGVALFETATHGSAQDQLRREGFAVIGGSALGDRLEADRGFGQEVLRAGGLHTAPSWRFTDHAQALDFLRRQPGRYVFKMNGADSERTRNFVGELEDGHDMAALLALHQARRRPGEAVDFILMQHLQGIEVGVGAVSYTHLTLPTNREV